MCPVFLPYGALLNAAFSRGGDDVHLVDNFTFHNIHFVFFELSATKLAVWNTFVLGLRSATVGTILALVIGYLTTRARDRRPPHARFSGDGAGRDPGHRARRRTILELHPAAFRAVRHACGSCSSPS